MKISLIGTGYVSLVSGVCLAEKGHQVLFVDVDPNKVAQIIQAVPPIQEKGLQELLKKSLSSNLWGTTDLGRAVVETDVSL